MDRDDQAAAMTPPVQVRHNGRLALFDPSTVSGPSIGACLRRGEFYEAGMLEYIRTLHITGNYVDAGAAIGTHTVFFALICDADHVDSFEPRDWVFGLLIKNIAINDLRDKVTAHMVGLASAEDEVTVSLDGRPCTFRTRRLDDVVTAKVALLKIDVEDMEVEVIRGARRILTDDRPRVFAEARTPELYEAMVSCLADLGYWATGRVFNSTPTHEFVPKPSWPVRLEGRARTSAHRLAARSPVAMRTIDRLRHAGRRST